MSNKELFQQKNRSEIAQNLLKDYKVNHPNLSTSQISKNWGMSQSTLSRLENGQLETIGIEIFVKVIQEAGKGNGLKYYLDQTDPDFSELLTKRFSHNLTTSIQETEKSSYYTSKDHFKLAILGTSKNSRLTREYVKNEFGNLGLKHLSELLEAGVLVENQNGVISHNNHITFPQKALKDSLLLTMKECYNADKFGKDENWLSFQTENVDREKMMKFVRNEFQQVYSKFKSALYSEEMKGSDTIFIGMVSDFIHEERKEVLK